MTTKEKILACAQKLFVKQGIDRTSTQQITEDVGVASGTLFVHFKTKQDLVDEIYLRIKRDAFHDLHESVDDSLSVGENVINVSREIIEYFLSHYDDFLFLDMFERQIDISPAVMKKAREEYAAFARIVNAWIDQGAFRDIDQGLLQGIIWSMITAFVKHYHASGSRIVQDKDVEAIWDAVRA